MTNKFTAIYTVSVGRYGASYPKLLRFEQYEGETVIAALNRAGYATHEAGKEWDISEATVYIFNGWPSLQGENDSDIKAGSL